MLNRLLFLFGFFFFMYTVYRVFEMGRVRKIVLWEQNRIRFP